MRILFLSNHYPPRHVGGFELYCAATAAALRTRGHEVLVLTTGDAHEADESVCRALAFDMSLKDMSVARHNRRCIAEQSRRFGAEAALVWNTYGLHHDAAFEALASAPTACYLMLHDLAYHGPRAVRALPLVAASQVIRFHFLRRGFDSSLIRVVYPGVTVPADCRTHGDNREIRLLFCGRIISYKGPHIALLALDHLPPHVTLTVIGEPDPDLDYCPQLVRWVDEHGLGSRVTFRGGLAHGDTLQEYHRHDILVFPSLWEEPLGLVVLEAMASGIPVIASRRGAPVELLTPGRTGLLHEPGDSRDLARAVIELSSASRRSSMGQAARQEIGRRFDFHRYIDDMERILSSLVGSFERPAP